MGVDLCYEPLVPCLVNWSCSSYFWFWDQLMSFSTAIKLVWLHDSNDLKTKSQGVQWHKPVTGKGSRSSLKQHMELIIQEQGAQVWTLKSATQLALLSSPFITWRRCGLTIQTLNQLMCLISSKSVRVGSKISRMEDLKKQVFHWPASFTFFLLTNSNKNSPKYLA